MQVQIFQKYLFNSALGTETLFSALSRKYDILSVYTTTIAHKSNVCVKK